MVWFVSVPFLATSLVRTQIHTSFQLKRGKIHSKLLRWKVTRLAYIVIGVGPLTGMTSFGSTAIYQRY